jgi:pimeloyl-ACP methyl ester carboxylesterase
MFLTILIRRVGIAHPTNLAPEDDSATIIIDGQEVAIEMSTTFYQFRSGLKTAAVPLSPVVPTLYVGLNYNIKLWSYGDTEVRADQPTVVLIHGWRGPFENNIFSDPSEANITKLADKLASSYQVLFLDWSSAAIEPISLMPYFSAGRIFPVAEWAKDQLAEITGEITLIGHSLGALVASEIGRLLPSDQEIIALDPAYPAKTYDLDNLQRFSIG